MNLLLNHVQGPSPILLDEELVLESLKRMKPSLSCGPDGIPPAIVKTYGSIFVPVLTYIFNNCLKRNGFPHMWKISRVRPILKAGPTSDATNYRAVSLLCACSKLFEPALHKVLSSSVQNVLIPNQHGFISGKSTITNLACFMEQASAAVSERGQLDVVYCDLSKAFDVVCHSLLFRSFYCLALMHHSWHCYGVIYTLGFVMWVFTARSSLCTGQQVVCPKALCWALCCFLFL